MNKKNIFLEKVQFFLIFFVQFKFYIYPCKKNFMEKRKLIDAREKKDYKQLKLAEELGISESSYCRREKGQIKINPIEWGKLAVALNVQIEDIYEADESQYFIYKDNAIGNYQGNNNINPISDFMLETQQKYIQKLEEEISTLKTRLSKYETN